MKILELIQFEFSYALSLAIIHSLWQSLLVMFIVTGLNRLNLFNSSEKKYLLHVAGLLTLFILFLVNIGISLSSPTSLTEFGISGAEIVLANFNEYIAENSSLSFTIHEMIAATWVIGCLLFFSKFLLGNLYLRSLKTNGMLIQDKFSSLVQNLGKKMGIYQNVRLIKSNKISIPLIMGFLRPIIIFPASYFSQLTPAQFESILIHELVHIKRNDYLINQLQSIIECIMFFNPFAWILSKQIRKYREYYCDDMVQSHIQDKNTYLKALYKVARFSGTTERTSVALFNNKSELVMRVKRMLNQKTEDHTYKPFFSLIIFALLFVGMSAFNNEDTPKFDADLKEQVEEFVNKTVEIPIKVISENDEPSIKETAVVSRVEIELKPKSKALIIAIPSLEKSISNVLTLGDGTSDFHSIRLDTVPDNKKIKELERKLEEKSKEMEELGAIIEKQYSQKMEIEMEKIEELAGQLEERYSANAEEWSKNFENPEMEQKIEELARQLEQKIEVQMSKFDELNSEEIEEFEQKVEKLAQEIEQYYDEDGNVTNEAKLDELKKQIQEESKKFKDVLSDYEIRHNEIFENGEIQELQEQIQTMAKELSAVQLNHEEIMDPISKELQEEIKALQQEIQLNTKPISQEIQNQMKEKAQEIAKIARELEKEMQKNIKE